jgi:hypothetical protein
MVTVHKLSLRPFYLALAFFLIRCAPGVTTKPAVESVPELPVKIIHGDTLVYRIAFTGNAERERFIYSFNRFLKESSFSSERYDSAGVLTIIKVLPSTVSPVPEKNPAIEPSSVPGTGSPEGSPEGEPSGEPLRGGSLRLYYPRGSINYPLAVLVNAYPFGEKRNGDSIPGYLSVGNSSAAAVTLKLAQKIRDGAGKTLNALDVIEQWTRHIREHPAEGLATFRYCDGIMDFLHGQEAIVRGISAIDNATIRIKFSPADPQALDRLRNRRLLPAAFKLGSYTVATVRENDHVLSANPAAADEKPFINELTVRCGGDGNPLLSFSLGRYDAVMLWSAPDIDYSRRNLLKTGSCSIVGRDRYFIACNLEDSLGRDFIRSAISGQELLGNFIKAEGAPISAVESDSAVTPSLPQGAAALPKPTVKEPLTILFRKDDAVSTIIAERLLAAVTHAGMQGTLTASTEKSYETALVGRSYACAIGWIPETVLFDKNEKLRVTAIFFNDDPDEGKLIRENREIPLFSIDWYLLAKSKVGLYKGKISGIYVK